MRYICTKIGASQLFRGISLTVAGILFLITFLWTGDVLHADSTQLIRPGSRFKSVLKRTYRSRPTERFRGNLSIAQQRLGGYLRTYNRLRKNDTKIIHRVFQKTKQKYRDVFQNMDKSSFFRSFNSSPDRFLKNYRELLYKLIILYSRLQEEARFQSNVKRIKSDGTILLNTSLSFYGLRLNPGQSMDTIRISSHPDRFSSNTSLLTPPLKYLSNQTFSLVVTPDGNVKIGNGFEKAVQRGRRFLKKNSPSSPGIITTLALDHLLTKSYLRDLFYQAWTRPVSGSDDDRGPAQMVYLPPLTHTGSFRKQSVFSKQGRDKTRIYRSRNNVVSRKRSETTQSLTRSDFLNLFSRIGSERTVTIETWFKHDLPISLHSLGQFRVKPESGVMTALEYREAGYRTRSQNRNKLLSKVVSLFEPASKRGTYGYNKSKKSFPGTNVKYPKGYHTVYRMNISLRRKRDGASEPEGLFVETD